MILALNIKKILSTIYIKSLNPSSGVGVLVNFDQAFLIDFGVALGR